MTVGIPVQTLARPVEIPSKANPGVVVVVNSKGPASGVVGPTVAAGLRIKFPSRARMRTWLPVLVEWMLPSALADDS